MSSEDIINIFIDKHLKHIRKVQDNMIFLEKNRDKLPFKIKQFELLRRCFYHDLGKFSKKLIWRYIDFAEYLKCMENNLPYEQSKYKNIVEARNIHYRKERHHPHFKTRMSKLDICEMCCDMAARAWEVNENDYSNYYKKNMIEAFPILKPYHKDILFILSFIHNEFDRKQI